MPTATLGEGLLPMAGSTDPRIHELGLQASARLREAMTGLDEIDAPRAQAAGSGRE
jgi:hypothetical protein